LSKKEANFAKGEGLAVVRPIDWTAIEPLVVLAGLMMKWES
jgi:hypothetical protein